MFGIAGAELRPNKDLSIQIRKMDSDSPAFPAHVDMIERPSLIVLYYVAPNWQRASGGELVLQESEHLRQNQLSLSIAPLANRAVLFLTNDEYWHGVNKVKDWERLVVLTEWLIL